MSARHLHAIAGGLCGGDARPLFCVDPIAPLVIKTATVLVLLMWRRRHVKAASQQWRRRRHCRIRRRRARCRVVASIRRRQPRPRRGLALTASSRDCSCASASDARADRPSSSTTSTTTTVMLSRPPGSLPGGPAPRLLGGIGPPTQDRRHLIAGDLAEEAVAAEQVPGRR